MAEIDRSWCLEGAVKPLPISHLDQKHAGSFTSAPTSQQTGSVHTAAISSRACQLGWNRDWEAKNSVYTPLYIAFVWALPLFAFGSRWRRPQTTHMHIPSLPKDDRSISVVGDQRTHPGVLSLLFFLVSVPVLHLHGSLAAGCPLCSSSSHTSLFSQSLVSGNMSCWTQGWDMAALIQRMKREC